MVNIEQIIIEFLQSKGYTVYADVPYDRPEVFITVERTGGQDINVALDNPTVAVQCWNTTRYKASEMALEVAEIMETFGGWSDKVTKCRQTSLYNFPDERQARYQIIFEIVNYKK